MCLKKFQFFLICNSFSFLYNELQAMASFYSHPSKSMAYVSTPTTTIAPREKSLTLERIKILESVVFRRKNLHSNLIHAEYDIIVSELKRLQTTMATGDAAQEECERVLPDLYVAFEKIRDAYIHDSFNPLIRHTNENTGCVLSEDVYVTLKRMCFYVEDVVNLCPILDKMGTLLEAKKAARDATNEWRKVTRHNLKAVEEKSRASMLSTGSRMLAGGLL